MDQSVAVSVVGTIAIVVSYLRARPIGSSFPPRVDDTKGRIQFLHTTRSLTAVLWPSIMSSFAGDTGFACVVPSMAWMLVVWWLDVRGLCFDGDVPSVGSKTFLKRGVHMEPSMLTALTFGLCGLAGARADMHYTRYIVYAIVACVLVVLPHVELSEEDHMAPLISEVQRAVLIYGIATVVTCVCLTRTSSTIAMPS